MSFARKRSANEASAEGFVCAKAQRQQDVGHEGVITGRDALSLRSSSRFPFLCSMATSVTLERSGSQSPYYTNANLANCVFASSDIGTLFPVRGSICTTVPRPVKQTSSC